MEMDRGTFKGPHPLHTEPEYDASIAVDRSKFWVICAVSNPARFKTRYALYRKFKQHILEDLQVNLVTVECALGDRDFQVVHKTGLCPDIYYEPSPCHGFQHIQVAVRKNSQLWDKENLQNIGLRHLPDDAKYVMFCDADITFCNRNIVTEIIHALQQHRVVQPFETCADLGPNGQIMQVHRSFGNCYSRGWEWKPVPTKHPHSGCYEYQSGVPKKRGSGNDAFGIPWHPGFCMAFRMDVIDKMSGLLEVGILGAGDHHMCGSIIGLGHLTLPGGIHENYKKQVMDWQELALKHIKKDLGFVNGTILHHFHGAKKARKYVSRWEILIQSAYDPETDVKRNSKGVFELISTRLAVRDGIRAYFTSRNEDSPDMEGE